jgi:putative oxidoreductase
LPGLGLLLLRLVAGIGLALQGFTVLRGQTSTGVALSDVLAALCGLFLLAGLWTPIVGVLGAVAEFSVAYLSHAPDPWPYILFGILGISIALLGPGAYSVDARLFGWKRIEIPDRKS